jgi:hypothetical protein
MFEKEIEKKKKKEIAERLDLSRWCKRQFIR